MRIAADIDFPVSQPDGFPQLSDEPRFDAARHLALEAPETTVTLAEFGYGQDVIAACPCDLAVTSAMRILSDDGVAAMQQVAGALEPYARGIERISRMVRGGAYQSRFLRDLCTSPELTDFISQICGTPLLAHTMPHQLGHLNYNPFVPGENVDKWHADTLRIDFVMFVTDPNAVAGGEFQYFHGTTVEVAALKKAGQALPADKIVSPQLPGAGYAVLQQGNLVVHRARGLDGPGERVTMVNGYVPAVIDFPDFTRFDQLFLADPRHVSGTEYARHIAWMARESLAARIDDFAFTEDRAGLAGELERIARMLSSAAAEIRDVKEAPIEHFGDE